MLAWSVFIKIYGDFLGELKSNCLMEVICYACGKGENPENTITAIEHCQKVNPNWRIEVDLQLTKDGQVVLFHDANLKRITGVDKSISETNYSELTALGILDGFHTDHQFQRGTEKFKIPLLQEVFERFPKTKFLLDVHTKDTKIVEKVITLVEDAALEKEIVLVSKYHYIIKKFRQERTHWTYGASRWEVRKLLLARLLRLDSYLYLEADIVLIPIMFKNRKILSGQLANTIIKHNKLLWIWLHEGDQVLTIDKKDQLERIRHYTVDAIFTSCPKQLYNAMLIVNT